MENKYFVSGIGTDVGKTTMSAILAECLGADYWKPIQSGSADGGDAEIVQKLISNSSSEIIPTFYNLQVPSSPHYAAEKENVGLAIRDIPFPKHKNKLLIEGPGGLMVPLNRKELIIDLIAHWKLPVILVSGSYLGGINHTLMSIEVMKKWNLEIKGIIYNQKDHPENIDFIESYSGIRTLGIVPFIQNINKKSIKQEADKLLALKNIL